MFAQKFEFSSKNLCISFLKNFIFQPSEAWLSSIMQNWNKSLSFHDCVPKGLTNFECPIWKLHTLNYHNHWCQNKQNLWYFRVVPVAPANCGQRKELQLWYFRVWNFKFAHSKLVRPKGSNERNLSDFSILCQIEESRASEGWKIKSLKNEIMKFYKWNSNSFSKTISNINPDVWSQSNFGHK